MGDNYQLYRRDDASLRWTRACFGLPYTRKRWQHAVPDSTDYHLYWTSSIMQSASIGLLLAPDIVPIRSKQLYFFVVQISRCASWRWSNCAPLLYQWTSIRRMRAVHHPWRSRGIAVLPRLDTCVARHVCHHSHISSHMPIRTDLLQRRY
jgi:hypothetical protein